MFSYKLIFRGSPSSPQGLPNAAIDLHLFAGPASICLPPAAVLAGLGLGNSAGQSGLLGSPIMSTTVCTLSGTPASAAKSMVVAPGLPALRKVLVDAILSGQFVDLTELPPAKGRTKPLSAHLEGQVVLLQTADYLQAKRLTPDLGIWLQCFALYTAEVLTKFPERATSLLLHAANIAKLSQKFHWPSWVIYDNSFWQEAAESGRTDWTRIDASLHAQCFHGMALSSEAWCSLCHSVDHLKSSCPLKPSDPLPVKRPAPYQPSSVGGKHFKEGTTPICGSYNKSNGECTFMPKCNYRHVCRRCHGPHPEPKCSMAAPPR